jgi:hypothetical protein
MVFGIVQLVCRAVPGQHAPQINAVPQQHATLEHFEQTGAAVHLALFKLSTKFCGSPRKRRCGKKAATSDKLNFSSIKTNHHPFYFGSLLKHQNFF